MPEPLGDIDLLGEDAHRILLRIHGGSVLTRPQTSGGCLFWFLDGSVIDDAGPRELQVRELIQVLQSGPAPYVLTERGRALAGRLRAE